MRHAVVYATLLAACALFATPASAQVREDHWFVNAGAGPSFGTFGSTPAANLSTGYNLNRYWSVGGELGVLPHAPIDKASRVAPSFSPVISPNDQHVNAYYGNVNLFVKATPWQHFTPYATAGVGLFRGTTVLSSTVGDTHLIQYGHETNPAMNLGVGTTYDLTKWLGVNVDYRHFIVNATNTQRT
jgi:opacity protein-like surface antigen